MSLRVIIEEYKKVTEMFIQAVKSGDTGEVFIEDREKLLTLYLFRTFFTFFLQNTFLYFCIKEIHFTYSTTIAFICLLLLF